MDLQEIYKRSTRWTRLNLVLSQEGLKSPLFFYLISSTWGFKKEILYKKGEIKMNILNTILFIMSYVGTFILGMIAAALIMITKIKRQQDLLREMSEDGN